MTDHLCSDQEQQMFARACFINKLIAASVTISERAGLIIKDWSSSGTGKSYLKGPASIRDVYTDADICAQDCIIFSLRKHFGEKLKIIGEESTPVVGAVSESGFSADVLQLNDKCGDTLRQIKTDEVVVWVDPVDGTYELVASEGDSGRRQEVTVLIGVAYKGRPIAGVIHQPFWGTNNVGRTLWAIDGLGVHGIDCANESSERILVTTRSHTTANVRDTLHHLKDIGLATDIQFCGGAGYKVIKCLEGATAYVFASPGCKKWDTCAPEAIITAAGGKLTDMSGREMYYGEDAQVSNSGGVLATSHWINHQEYVDNIPQNIKDSLPERRVSLT